MLRNNQIISLSLTILTAVLVYPESMRATDYTIGTDGTHNYVLAYVASLGGNTLQIQDTNGIIEWDSHYGAVGVRLYDVHNNLSSPTNVAYSSNIVAIADGYQATATVTTANGSVITVVDSYSMIPGRLNVTRDITVTTANANDQGFLVMFSIRKFVTNTNMTDFDWFAPSTWYGNQDQNFGYFSSRISWDGQESATGVESLSAPFIANYHIASHLGLTLKDQTSGLKETIAADQGMTNKVNLVDSRINIAGLGLRLVTEGTSNYAEMFQAYPGYTKQRIWPVGTSPAYRWRFLPVQSGLTRRTKFQLNLQSYASFPSLVRSTWRDAYTNLAVVNNTVNPTEALNTLYDYVNNSYGVVGGAPQYMTNTTIFQDTSGFLWRNADLASLLLAAGYDKGRRDYIFNALNVLNDQVNNDRIDNDPLERARAEGYDSVLRAYEVELAHGTTYTNWYSFVTNSANSLITSINASGWTASNAVQGLDFLVDVANYTGNSTYLSAATDFANYLWTTNGYSNYWFWGGIYSFSPTRVMDRESGCLALYGFLGLYDITKDTNWITKAQQTADFVESSEMIENVKNSPEDATGLEKTNETYGNPNIPPYGLSFIGSDGMGVDIFNADLKPEFYRLYNLTGDQHYLNFATFLEHNCLLYTDLGDHVYMMDDYFESSGWGFLNEYTHYGPSDDPGGSGRGRGRGSNIGWCPYVLLSSAQRLKDLTGNYFITNQAAPADYNVAQFTTVIVTNSDNGIHDAANIVDGDLNTRWAATNNTKPQTIIVDLGQKCNLDTIKTAFEMTNIYYQYKLEYSINNSTWYTFVDRTSNTNLTSDYYIDTNNVAARYIRLTITGTETVGAFASVRELQALGYPVRQYVASYGKTATASSWNGANVPVWAIDHNYSTAWVSSSTNKPQWLMIDLGRLVNVTKIATLFEFPATNYYQYKIEYSTDQANWYTYADRTSQTITNCPYIDINEVLARYVRITITGVQNPTVSPQIKEFKVFTDTPIGNFGSSSSNAYVFENDFSTVQGSRNWYYMQGAGTNTTTFSNMTWQTSLNQWQGAYAYNLIWGPSELHPDSNDTAIAWMAPQSGTVRIVGNPRKSAPGGDGVNVRILQNTNQVWPASGWQYIAGTNTVGVTHDFTISVASGDIIYFVLNKNGDNSYDETVWNPDIIYEPFDTNTYVFEDEFSDQQGYRNWYYKEGIGTNATVFSNMTWQASTSQWKGTYQYNLIWAPSELHPDTNDTAVAWKAPRSGLIRITANPRKSTSGGNGVNVRILDNSQQLWPSSGWQYISGTDTTGTSFVVSTNVNTGDMLYFVVDKYGSGNSYDETVWNPQIAYQSTNTFAFADDFSAQQGYRNWYYLEGIGTNATVFSNMTWQASTSQWKGTYQYNLIWAPAELHPDNNETAIAWKAPRTGTLRITGNPRKAAAAGDGVNVRIEQNATQVWPTSGWQYIAGTNTIGVYHDFTINVSTGDLIYFILDKYQNNNYDETVWNPQIAYQ